MSKRFEEHVKNIDDSVFAIGQVGIDYPGVFFGEEEVKAMELVFKRIAQAEMFCAETLTPLKRILPIELHIGVKAICRAFDELKRGRGERT